MPPVVSVFASQLLPQSPDGDRVLLDLQLMLQKHQQAQYKLGALGTWLAWVWVHSPSLCLHNASWL